MLHIFCNRSTLAVLLKAHVSFWPRGNPSSLPVHSMPLLQGDFGNPLVMSKTCHAVMLMEASSLIPRMLSHALKLTAGRSQIAPKVPIHELAGYGIKDIEGTMPRSCFPIFSRNRTFPKSCTSIFSRNGTFQKLHLTTINGIAFTWTLKQYGISSQTSSRPSFWAYTRILQGAISVILEMLKSKWMVICKPCTSWRVTNLVARYPP